MPRVAFFSPLPPSKSGIADYSQTLIEHLAGKLPVEAFAGGGAPFDPKRFDLALYHIGNNPWHAFVYREALRNPGVAVMHESNLHHLIADLTIGRNDWDGYMAEVEYNGDAEDIAFAKRVRALEVGPDYEGLPMTRRLLECSKAVVVHSQFMVDEMRAQGFRGPIARIPHGAWIPDADRFGFRHRLGLEQATPLIGIFGFLKPYKRIAESLRAFRRLVRLDPAAKMILVGEPHPELRIRELIDSLGLEGHARVLGFTPIEDFIGYLAACDIVLNLRYPTVGESSGSLLRALGLGKAAMVSDVGSFAEFPDDVCLKVPVGPGEEDQIFEFLNLLVSRPEVRRAIGENARRYVERECNWDLVATRYAEFLTALHEGRTWPEPRLERAPAVDASSPELEQAGVAELPKPASPAEPAPAVAPEYISGWAENPDSRAYIETHKTRLVRTLEITPSGTAEDRALEMGAYLQITPALKTKLGYGEVRGCYYGESGRVDRRRAVSTEGEIFECEIDHFNAEKDVFPYPDGHFSTVLCCELIEHLLEDPMHLMSEINRILKAGGHLVLTTPNVISNRAISAIVQGYHPGFFHAYVRPRQPGEEVEARHNREYSPREVQRLLENSGFAVTLLETGEFRDEPHPEHGWVYHLLDRYALSTDLRGDGIYVVGEKTEAVRDRYPGWLYT